jgi:serine phosphatase RsbU (regulator of sigma subunit)
MDIAVIAQFAVATLLPVAACALLMGLRLNTKVANLPEKNWQVIVGIVFGLIAIYGTEAGIPVNGAMMNVRDAAPLAAGLLFGGPAGIIAGLIGGVERWFAVMWGVGEFTRVACSVATIFSGVYAALLRKYFFERHIPNLSFAFATGVVAEVLHLMLVFVTHPENTMQAFVVTRACALPMINCVGFSMMLCSLVTHLIKRQPLLTPAGERNVARILHTRMLIAVVVAFLITVSFTAVLETNLSKSETEKLLQLNIEDVERDIVDASDENLLELTEHVTAAFPSATVATSKECSRLATELDVAEINVIGRDGIIVASSEPAFVGFDMASGEQSAEFLVLLPGGGETKYVQSYQPISYDANTSRKYAGVAIEDGFVQVGYDSQDFQDDLSTQVEAAVKNRHVGQSGALVVIDEANRVIGTRNDTDISTVNELVADASTADAGKVFETTFGDESVYACCEDVEGYRIIALLPTAEANSSRDASVLIMAFMEVLVFAALFLVIYAVIKLVVVRGIRKMNRQLDQITKGDLDVMLDVRTASELSSLSDDINQTVGVLKESLALVQADLNMAANIQANTLPDITSAITERNEFDLYATMEPAKEVGGDFYDFFVVDDDHLALVVADVSGKGVPAALFMMQSKVIIKMEALSGLAPDKVLEHANTDLSEKNEENMFTTAWIGVLEISTGKLTYADAGHEKLAIYHNGAWELPKKPNGAVALASFGQEDYDELPEKYRFRNHTMVLQPGDAVLQYTDGVTEATNAEEDLFGEDRLLSALNDAPSADPDVVLPFVHDRIAAFVGDSPQFDDITMLGLLFKGKEDL